MTKEKIVELFRKLVDAGGSAKINTRSGTDIRDIEHLEDIELVYIDKRIDTFGDMALVSITMKGKEWLEENEL